MGTLDAYSLIIGGSLVILISFLFNRLARKTNIPSVLMLIVLGIGIQYLIKYFGFHDINFFPILEVLGIVGLIMIVLEAALELELTRAKIPVILKSTAVALIGLLGSSFAAAGIIHAFLPMMDFLQALLYATPLSILSSAIIIPSVSHLKTDKKEFLIYESTVSDILGIMMFYFLISLRESHMGQGSGADPVMAFIGGLSVTVVVSLVVSYLLIVAFQHISHGPKLFLLIAILMLLYSIGKKAHLSPLIVILVFGLMVSNAHLFFRWRLRQLLDWEKFQSIEKGLHILTLETAFVVRTFFFVIFGASIALSSLLGLDVVVISLVLLGSIYLVRWFILMTFTGANMMPQIWVAPRGLITVLLFYAIPPDMMAPEFNNGILLFIILATGFVMTLGMIHGGDDKTSEKDKATPPVPETEIRLPVDGTQTSVGIEPPSDEPDEFTGFDEGEVNG
ncbi:MAG: cation:proton antiporter [Flavobacteriales bacterium]|nr:cation:proton antiporter [Flavobacteriales bacterium]